MLKNFLLKKMAEKQLVNMPADQREKIMKIIAENPELFVKIAQETQARVGEGKTQEVAMTEAMIAHQDELKELL